MKILLTGSNGFLGSYISRYFRQSEYEFTTLSRNNADINLYLNESTQFIDDSFDLVIHAAGKAHFVPKTIEDAKSFLDINVTGTYNLLKALESKLPQRFVFISSVAVYGRATGVLLDTNTPILAADPYGLSKIQAEATVLEWCQRHKVICTILRLPLVYGKNPPGNLRAMIQGIKKGYYFNIAGGKACKSIVRAEDVAQFILPASEVGGIYHLTDGHHPNFQELSKFIGVSLGRSWIPDMPLWMANIVAKIGDKIGSSFPLNSEKLEKITSELTFDDSLAKSKFGWAPKPVVNLEVLK